MSASSSVQGAANPSARPAVRYQAQAAPSEGSRSASEAKTTAWVGAFERVLGDHPVETGPPSDRHKAAKFSNDVRGPAQEQPGSQQRDTSSGGEWNSTGGRAIPTSTSDAGPAPSSQSSPRRPLLHSQRSKTVQRSATSASEESRRMPESASSVDSSPPDRIEMIQQCTQPQSISTGLPNKASNRTLQPTPPASVLAPASIGPKAAPMIRSYAPEPEDEETDKTFGSEALASQRLATITSGPCLIEVSSRHQHDRVIFDDLYLNHAPGLQPVRLKNILEPGKSVLVRLQSDLGHAVSFMRRKRIGPKNELDNVVWPSNTLAWAKGGGLSPAKLRELRAISTNLEVADSLILEGGASTEVFVIFRPNLIAPASSSTQLAALPVPPVPSRSSSQSSTATSPPMLGAVAGHVPPQSLPVSLISPRSKSPILSGEGFSSTHRSQPTAMVLRKQELTTIEKDAVEIQGKLTIRAWPLPALQQAVTPPTMPSHRAEEASTASSESSATSSRPTSHHGSTLSSGGGPSFSTAMTEMSDVEPQMFHLDLKARFCRPQIAVTVRQPGGAHVDPESSQTQNVLVHRSGIVIVDFGDVIAGATVETEVHLINQSAIDCFWQGKVDCGDDPDVLPSVSLSKAESSEAITLVSLASEEVQYQPNIIPPRSIQKLRLSLHQEHAPQDMEELLVFSNLHNTSNSVRILVRANILADSRDDSLVVESGDFLDFGDCCGGQWARQLLVLRNTANYSLDVALSAQKNHEVRFRLAEMALNQDYDHESEEICVGATAASSDGTKSDTTNSFRAPSSAQSSHGSASKADTLERNATSHRSLAMELIRTPTHHASTALGTEVPPMFDLTSPDLVDVEKTPVTLTPHTHPPAPKHIPDEIEDCDGSSVQSQAGSRPGSPTPQSDVSEMDIRPCDTLPPGTLCGKSSEATVKDRPAPKASVLAWREASIISEAGSTDGSAGDDLSQGVGAASISTGWSSTSSPKWRRANSSGIRDEDEAVSVGSDSTMYSQEARSIEGATVSSVAPSASSAARGHSRSLISTSTSALRSVQDSEEKELEDLTLRPGEEVRIIVSFRPGRGEIDETYSAGRLLEHTFRLILDYAKARGASLIAGGGSRLRGSRERRTVLCRTRTCTSFIGVSPKDLDFGETNVGTRKTSQIIVTNYSELSARVDLRFVSKVLSMYRDEMTIPAGQSIHLSVDHSPRRVNLAYSKQITVANLLNRRNDQIIEVRSKNVDKQRVSFHSLLYRILTSNGSNFLEFGDVNINSSRIRSFSIENVTKGDLTLDLTTAHPEDISLYVKASNASPTSATIIASATDSQPTAVPTTGKDYENHEPTGSVMARALPVMSAAAREDEDGQPAIKAAKGAELKERFLETISSDTPAHIRQENTSWRTAQKLSHYRKDAVSAAVALGQGREGGQGSGSGNGTGSNIQAKKSGQVNLLSALRKGGKGRATMPFGCSVAFKDRTLVQEFEYLDLATGPPLVAKRISTKSRCFQLLDQLEMSSRLAKGSAKSREEQAKASSPSVQGESVTTTLQTTPATPAKKQIPHALAAEIKSKGGTLSRLTGVQPFRAEREGEDRSPALTAKRKVRHAVLDPTDVSTLTLDELLGALEAQPSALSTLFFNSAQAEEKHVRTEINLQRELRRAIETKQLVPVGTVRISAGEERQVVAVFNPNGSTRPHILGTARKQDSRIFLRLMEYDLAAVRASDEFSGMADLEKDELPVRDLMVRTTVCRALLELGQPHINFGHMEKGETKTKKILIHNRSEWSARYCIRKSGSIASGDIKLSSGRYGVVSAHGKREVEFIFSPSLTGAYQEKLIIENVADRDRDLTVFLKATVRKKPNFNVEPTTIDFGECRPGKLTEAESFSISNTTNKARTFVVAIDSSDLRHQRTIMDLVFSTSDEDQGRTTLSKAEESSIAEEVEHISQKLKIANRKGQGDKIKKYEGRLAELNVKAAGTGSGSAPTTTTSASTSTVLIPSSSRPFSPGAHRAQPSADGEDHEGGGEGADVVKRSGSTAEEATRAPLVPPLPSVRLKRVSSTVTISLGPNARKRIFVRVRTSAVHTALTAQDSTDEQAALMLEQGGEDICLNVLVHEVKNQDEMRIVSVRARALWTSSANGNGSGETSAGVEGEDEGTSDAPQGVEGRNGVGEADEVTEEADPLPLDDSSAVIFTSDCQL